MIWSPLCNLLLYGKTANVKAAKAQGVLMGIGSDWSPTGSKNLLGELKVARVASAAMGDVFSDREIVAMATRNAAKILKWDHALGTIEAGKHADLLVVAGRSGDPYARLLEARETDIILVVIGGTPRYGRPKLMGHFGAGSEPWRVGSAVRVLNLTQQDADPVVGALKLADARDRLRDGMRRLPELARNVEETSDAAIRPAHDTTAPQWFLSLDNIEPAGEALRPHLPFGPSRALTASLPAETLAALAVPLSQIVGPLELDPLTVADDGMFLERLDRQPNLPKFVKDGLPDLY